jgi:hypothetical protein
MFHFPDPRPGIENEFHFHYSNGPPEGTAKTAKLPPDWE